MNKLLSVLVIAALPGLALGSGASDQVAPANNAVHVKPVVSVVALTPDQAEALAKVRSDYKARKTALESEYQALLDALLAKSDADNS